ncbi:MAG: RNA 2',3'-cyclic phosphodiesterase [Mycobacteriales bacterium]
MFAAVVPPDPALDHLGGSLARLRDRPDAPRWVGRDAQHVTLAFFGEVPEPQVPALTGALGAALGAPSVHLRLAGAGTFPERGSPRVLWVGVDGDVDTLAVLAGAAADAARSVGVPVDRRPYRPHLTVGRWPASTAPPTGRPLLAALRRYTGPHFAAGSVVLMRSHHGPRPRYETVAAWGPAAGPRNGTPGGAVGTHRPTSRQDRSYQA